MNLSITTPLEQLVDEDGVLSVRAEDMSGSFGSLPGHANFLTALVTTVVRWKGGDGSRRYCAVRGGLLSVKDRGDVAVAPGPRRSRDGLWAGLRAFAAENEARIQMMAAAHAQVGRQLVSLQAKERRIRQEEITAEVIELAAGEASSASSTSAGSTA